MSNSSFPSPKTVLGKDNKLAKKMIEEQITSTLINFNRKSISGEYFNNTYKNEYPNMYGRVVIMDTNSS